MRKLLLAFALLAQSAGAQQLANTEWLGTNPPSPNLWIHFGSTDTLYYSTGTGFSPLDLYSDVNGTLALFDLIASQCTDTGFYSYVITQPNVTFTLINDSCVARRNTMINYHWTQISTGINNSPADEIRVYIQDSHLYISSAGQETIRIFDVQGRMVLDGKYSREIDLGFLSHGIYQVLIYKEGQVKVFKVAL